MKIRFVGLVMLLVMLTSCDSKDRMNPIKQVNDLTPGIGSLIIFPDGWELHSFTVRETWISGSSIPVKQEYVFICTKNREYRFCTPMIEDINNES